MVDRGQLEKLFVEHGCDDFKWIEPRDIVVSQWVRMKCQFGCEDHGTRVTCPPNNPSVSECENLFSEFSGVALFHFGRFFENPEDRNECRRGLPWMCSPRRGNAVMTSMF